mgnify:CR=1 FL=1
MTDFRKCEDDVGLSWQIDQWEDAHKGDMFVILQNHSDNDGVLMIGKFESEPYEKISPYSGKSGHVIDLEILSAFDRTSIIKLSSSNSSFVGNSKQPEFAICCLSNITLDQSSDGSLLGSKLMSIL